MTLYLLTIAPVVGIWCQYRILAICLKKQQIIYYGFIFIRYYFNIVTIYLCINKSTSISKSKFKSKSNSKTMFKLKSKYTSNFKLKSKSKPNQKPNRGPNPRTNRIPSPSQCLIPSRSSCTS